MKCIAVTVMLALAALAATATAGTIHVDWNGGGDYTTLWAANTAASDGDTILVAPGTYSGAQNTEVNLYAKNLVFESEGGPEATIIDGESSHGGFYITNGQDSTTVVRGFTFLNCYRPSNGAAFEISNTAPIVEDCVFEACSSGSNGGALAFYASSTVVRDCVFWDNWADFRGGAIHSYVSSVTVSRCLFDENLASETWRGGAVYSNSSADLYTYCTFAGNRRDAVRLYYSADFRMANCIITGTLDGVAVNDSDADGTEISHCVIFGNAGGDSLSDHHHDNLFVDPLFCDGPGGDFTHCADSQCLPGVNGWGELVGVYGEGCPGCDSPVEDRSWGAIKALYR